MKTCSMCRRRDNNTRGGKLAKTREPLDPPRSTSPPRYLWVQVAGKWKTGGQRSSCPSLNPSVREEKLTKLSVLLVHRCAHQLPHATFFDNRGGMLCVKSRHSFAPLPLKGFKLIRVAARLDLTSVLVATPSQNQQNSTKRGARPLKAAVVAFKPQHTKT